MSPFQFLTDETAAITVDWVVLSAATVGFGLAAAVTLQTGLFSLGTNVGAALTGAQVATQGLFGSGAPAPAACDWYCLYAQFHEAENGPYDPVEWGPDVNDLADARLEEFRRYTTDFLMDHVAGLRASIESNQDGEPYTSYYQGEIDAIMAIIAERG